MPIQHMPRLTGQAIKGGEYIKGLFGQGFGLEIIYAFVIIACSIMIYLATREIYSLTKHKGIKYFRNAFLFFAIAYFFRSFIKFVLISLKLSSIHNIAPMLLGTASLLIFMYFSIMAIFYLLYSVIWEKLEKPHSKIYLFHILALLLAITTLLSKNPIFYLIINILLLILILIAIYFAKIASTNQIKTSKKKHYSLYIIYVLLFIFWILNILDILIPNFLRTIQLLIYLASITIFFIITYKVLRKTGSS
jgi:hypothetical protein